MIGGVDITVPGGESSMFEISNRNKKGLHLDMQTKKGREVFERLIKTVDVFLTNLRQSTTHGLGIDYESMRTINPAVILPPCATAFNALTGNGLSARIIPRRNTGSCFAKLPASKN